MHVVSRLARLAAASLCVAVAAPALAGAGAGAIRWVADDWPRAVAEARRRDVPLVVDTWVPW